MRSGVDDVWQGLALGQWLAHERRMHLLGIADEVRLITQVEAAASKRKSWFDLARETLGGFCRFLPSPWQRAS